MLMHNSCITGAHGRPGCVSVQNSHLSTAQRCGCMTFCSFPSTFVGPLRPRHMARPAVHDACEMYFRDIFRRSRASTVDGSAGARWHLGRRSPNAEKKEGKIVSADIAGATCGLAASRSRTRTSAHQALLFHHFLPQTGWIFMVWCCQPSLHAEAWTICAMNANCFT